MGDRPRVGISACLLGEPVRHDGRHKRDAWLVDVLGPQVEWVSVCPEVEAGFGTPRETMELVHDANGRTALMTTATKRDLTDILQRYAERRVEELARADLDGYVLKADSPSCGLEGPGLFAAVLTARMPELPIVDERQLDDGHARQRFADGVRAHHRARSVAAESSAWRDVSIVRMQDGKASRATDRAATEEPLEIRLHGQPFAVIMRTPGTDRELAAGFLLAERVIRNADELGTIEYCMDRGDNHNVVNVTLAPELGDRIASIVDGRRNVTTNSSCGLCGRRTIESLATDVAPLGATWRVGASTIGQMPAQLRERQAIFDETGGLHAAGLFTHDGQLVDVSEDVGRHNAVDKIVGRRLMRDALPLSSHVLCVSGRTSFEIVQKALFAGIPVVAAVSAPSTLAIDLAQAFGITLVGFVRGGDFTIYAHAERVEG
ncbi:MAG TPA: formate dehydrogenase accessory sulfurtransferase FdhD [Vicinamibacterales bacterium]|nr:formate dehydrogenase accessory sulfurtransferase FdhD [Vicinamibacterales bacterium]